jgi:hypothetical protein
MRIKKEVEIMFVFNWNNEHIVGYLIHLNKNKTK